MLAATWQWLPICTKLVDVFSKSLFLDINGRSQNLGKIATEQRKWIKDK
jgi:hypothetical protein